MPDYIDREKYCKEQCLCNGKECTYWKCPIMNAPKADVEPVKHAHWEYKKMKAIEMIKLQIDGLKFNIEYDTKQLDELVKNFKERVQRLDALDIVAWDVTFDQKRISEICNRIKNDTETLQILQHVVDNAKEE